MASRSRRGARSRGASALSASDARSSSASFELVEEGSDSGTASIEDALAGLSFDSGSSSSMPVVQPTLANARGAPRAHANSHRRSRRYTTRPALRRRPCPEAPGPPLIRNGRSARCTLNAPPRPPRARDGASSSAAAARRTRRPRPLDEGRLFTLMSGHQRPRSGRGTNDPSHRTPATYRPVPWPCPLGVGSAVPRLDSCTVTACAFRSDDPRSVRKPNRAAWATAVRGQRTARTRGSVPCEERSPWV